MLSNCDLRTTWRSAEGLFASSTIFDTGTVSYWVLNLFASSLLLLITLLKLCPRNDIFDCAHRLQVDSMSGPQCSHSLRRSGGERSSRRCAPVRDPGWSRLRARVLPHSHCAP